ncbi:MAG TPA: GNAT family N-acetyltransferase [Ktedonobacterales bacterium]
MGGVYAIARVDAADSASLAAFVAVHEEAAAWLWARGIEQWRPGECTLATLRRERAEGPEVYVARRDGAVAGGFTLQWDDPENWEEQPPVAGYLHALCVRRADAGHGLGAMMLDFAGRRVAKMGRPWLRLDCWKGNATLRAYYEGLGFRYQGIGDHGWAALYQRSSMSFQE